jgi:putative ATP-binding cassette transporter
VTASPIPPPATPTPAVGLDRQTLSRLLGVVGAFLTSERGGRAAALGGALLALLLAINALNVVSSYVGRDFMTAIEQRDAPGFAYQAMLYAAVFAALTVAAVIYRFIEERLGLFWREWFTRRLASVYLEHHFYYHLKIAGGLTNPDQRIADDVRAFTTTTLSLALVFLNGTFTVIAFSGVLWTISRPLFATAVLYAVLGSTLAYLIGRPLVRLNYDQSDREADFRAELVHVRENAESIALLGSEPHLQERLFTEITALIVNYRRIIAVNRNLGFFSTGYNYMILLIPALVVAPLFIRGQAEFGVIPQSAMAFAQLIGAFSLIVTQFPQLTLYAAVLARLNALGEAYQDALAPAEVGIQRADDDGHLVFERVTLIAPLEERPLVRDFSFDIPPGGRLSITVPDHIVMSALEGALAGLWQHGSGRVTGSRDIEFLPARPYLPPASLRDVLAAGGAAIEDPEIAAALHRVGLEDAVERAGGLDVPRDWNAVLAPDEQRLINVARLLLARPRFAVLATPETTFGNERAADVLAALRERQIGYIVLAREALGGEHFDCALDVAADGSWRQTDAVAA